MTGPVVMQIVGLARGGESPNDGAYVLSFDANARGGRGELRVTRDRGRAMTFPSDKEAMAFWRQQSRVMPLRPYDGKPNRPLTAYSVMVEPL